MDIAIKFTQDEIRDILAEHCATIFPTNRLGKYTVRMDGWAGATCEFAELEDSPAEYHALSEDPPPLCISHLDGDAARPVSRVPTEMAIFE